LYAVTQSYAVVKEQTEKEAKASLPAGWGTCPEPEDLAPNDEGYQILICDARYAGTQNASSAFKVQMHIEN